MMSSTTRNPSIKRLEKEISRESKAEGETVKRTLKDLSRTEKEVRRAQKATGSADTMVDKLGHHEHKTAKSVNDAIREHDLAVVKLHAAEKDAQLKHKQQTKMIKELEAKKGSAERAIQAQKEHNEAREKKLAQILSGSRADSSPRSGQVHLPGQSGPALQNNGHAPGYGYDHNHTMVDSEGNSRGGQAL